VGVVFSKIRTFEMSSSKGRNLAIIVLVVIVALVGFAGLFLLKPEGDIVMAQEGDASKINNKMSTGEAMREKVKSDVLRDIMATPFDVAPVGEPGNTVTNSSRQVEGPNWAHSFEREEDRVGGDAGLEGIVPGSRVEVDEEVSRGHPLVIR
jgi:hypothetical protein